MMICPNKNLAEWKHLESFQGAAKALMLWDYFKGNVPLEAYKDKNFKIPSIGKTVNKLTEDSIKDSGILPELSISFNKPLDEIVHLYKQFIESKISIGTLENVSVENGIVTSNEKGTISALINIIGAKTFETEQDYIDEIKAFLGLTYYPNKTEINEFNKEFTKDNSIIIRETNEIIASENNIIKPFESATIQQFKNTIELGSANSYSNEIKSGVAEIFKSNPELVAIGTQEQYSQYLDTIFPDSKVKDIVYHGTKELNKVKEEGFDTSKIGTGESTSLQGKGFYFAKHPHILKSYAKGERGGIISALLNVENPLQEKKFTKFLREQLGINNVDASNVYEVGNKVTKWLEDNNKDSVLWEQGQTIPKGTEQQEDNIKRIFGNYFDFSTRLLNSPHYSVIKPEQIHILGSKQDIQGFKDFVNKNKTIDELNKEIKNIIEERKVKDQNSIETEQKLKAEETKMLNDYFDNLGMIQYNTGTFTKIVRSAVETTKIVPPTTQFKFYKNPVKTVDVTENGKYKVSISFTTVNPNSSIKELRQQGLAEYPADAVKQDVKDSNFLDAVANNEFEGLSGKFKEVYQKKLEDGEYQLGCKI